MSDKEKKLEDYIITLEKEIVDLKEEIEDLESERDDLKQEKEYLLYDLTESKELADSFENDLDNMKDSRQEIKDELDDITSKFEDLEEENKNLLERIEIVESLENWKEIIPNRDDPRGREIYEYICDLLESFQEYPLDMARLYRERPNETLDNVLNEKVISLLNCKGASLLNSFNVDSI